MSRNNGSPTSEFPKRSGSLKRRAVVIALMAAVSYAVIVFAMSNSEFTPTPQGTVTNSPQIPNVEVSVPKIADSSLNVLLFVDGLESPTNLAFLDNSTILVLQKNDGNVMVIRNGALVANPALTLNVNGDSERGLLGIAVDASRHGNKENSVFLYLTEEADDQPLRNRVYKYFWDGNHLINSTLVLDLPALPGPNHDGGELALDNDGYLYAVIGDLNHRGILQNVKDDLMSADDTGVILRVDNDGSPSSGNPFLSLEEEALQRYYAYGIRNSFGMDFDPISGKLWMTENGPELYDEINIVEPGFNSGWVKVMGPLSRNANVTIGDLVHVQGSYYADPLFSWKHPVGLTDIEFFNSPMLGQEYENNIFVGDINNGNLYFFKVNTNRTSLVLEDPSLTDLVADDDSELSSVKFGTGFRGITDIETGPDGYLYVLSFNGQIYQIEKK